MLNQVATPQKSGNPQSLEGRKQENSHLRSIIAPILAGYFTQFKMQTENYFRQQLAIFQAQTKKQVDQVRNDFTVPFSEPANPTTHIGTTVPDRSFGQNDEIYYLKNGVGTVTHIYRKVDGHWLVEAMFPVSSQIARTATNGAHPTWQTLGGVVDGSNTEFVLPGAGAVALETIRPYYKTGLQHDFTYNAGTRTLTLGFAPNTGQGNEMVIEYAET